MKTAVRVTPKHYSDLVCSADNCATPERPENASDVMPYGLGLHFLCLHADIDALPTNLIATSTH